MSKIHELKCWHEYYEAIFHNKKRFEYRRNDRDFKVGDKLQLREWDHNTDSYTGREMLVLNEYQLNVVGRDGLPYTVMSILILDRLYHHRTESEPSDG